MSSAIDELFEEIFGYRPTKSGEAFEMLCAAVSKLISEEVEVLHNQRLPGLFTHDSYQVDVLVQKDGKERFGEAKDHTVQKTKVGRAELLELAAKLNDLSVEGAMFFSATDYTKPAKNYAAASKQIIGKEIHLFQVRLSVEKDEAGRLTAIYLTLHFPRLVFDDAKLGPVFTEEGHKKLAQLAENKRLNAEQQFVPLGDVILDKLFDDCGNQIATAEEVLLDHPAQEYGERYFATILTPGAYVRVSNELVGIRGITHDIPVLDFTKKMIITVNGRAKVFHRDEKTGAEWLLTDLDLKRVTLEEGGRVVLAAAESRFEIKEVDEGDGAQ
jgi:Restriction endonuclease